MEQTVSGVGVLDKSMAILDAVASDAPCSLGDLVQRCDLPKPTIHRLVVALEVHGMVRRDGDGRFVLGARLVGLGRQAAGSWSIAEVARPALESLRADTGESVQIYVRDGDHRVCLVSLESPQELRTIVPEGSRLPLEVGSAGRILAALDPTGSWVESVEERAPGVASVSAPVVVDGVVVGAVGVSGPVERLGRRPGAAFGETVTSVARSIGEAAERR